MNSFIEPSILAVLTLIAQAKCHLVFRLNASLLTNLHNIMFMDRENWG